MKKVLIAGALSVATLVALVSSRSPAADSKDATLVFDRIWVDHLPKHDRDTIKVFLALTEQPIGAFQSLSQWQGAYELFRFEEHGGEVRAVYPQSGDREKFTVSATRCTEGQMTYCLEIKGASRGTKRYYSMKGWEIGSQGEAAARVTALVNAGN